MKVCKIEVERIQGCTDKVATVRVGMMLEAEGQGYVFRRWEVQIPRGSEDPTGAWLELQAVVAALRPQPVNEDASIRDLTQRIPAPAALATVPR